MNIIQSSNKFLFKLAKSFIQDYNISYEETHYNFYEDEGETSNYSDKIIKFLYERGFLKHGSEEFFYVFIFNNREYLFSSKPFDNYSLLRIPELRRFAFEWNTKQTLTISATYAHSLSTFLDDDQVADRISYLRYNGDIYPADGDEIDYDTLDSELDEDDIDNIREIS